MPERCAASFLAHREWRSLDPLGVVMPAENAEMERKGSTREIVTLPVHANSPAEHILSAWSRTYDSESGPNPPSQRTAELATVEHVPYVAPLRAEGNHSRGPPARRRNPA